MKDKRNPIAETILEVEDEDDSPEIAGAGDRGEDGEGDENVLSDWLDEENTSVIQPSNTAYIKPIFQGIPKNDSNDVSVDVTRNANSAIKTFENNKSKLDTQHTSGPQTLPASDSRTHTAVSTNNKYDNTQHTLSHQSVVHEVKNPFLTTASHNITPAPTAAAAPPPLTQMSSDDDSLKVNTENSKRISDTKTVNSKNLLNKMTENDDSNKETKINKLENHEIQLENAKNEKQINVTEKESIIDTVKSNDLHDMKSISPIVKSSRHLSSSDCEDFGKNFSPLFPESNYVSPSLTAPLGPEGEETLEVSTYMCMYVCVYVYMSL